ncbi:hypothetical protein PAXRUDRAFT_8865 [Paxillus rubicundulus Ve08.2h10]|uniref:Uncharacterized protein n=1 Tax=Paxillus rubicundulus Ve08.2h10 TaxID=930991 RepID=A0A0D0ECI6_9AGAM|nr:hypothetical protein PAXRUDRAFT_8865 [Paxillus rubicundulus Ve08.2h10]
MLRCALPEHPDRPLCIYLQPLAGGNNQWVRTRIGELVPVPRDGEPFENTEIFAKEDTSFFDPRKRKRAASNDTSITSVRGSFARSSSASSPLERQAVQESPTPSLPAPIPASVQDTRRPPATPTGPGLKILWSRDGRGELPLPALVTGGSHGPSNPPPPTPIKISSTQRTIRQDSRMHPPLSRDASNDHFSPISAAPISAPDSRLGFFQESRNQTLQPFEGPVSKIWYNESYMRAHPKRPQFWNRERKISRSLSPQHLPPLGLAWPHSPPGEQHHFNQYAVQSSRPRSNSLTIPGESEPAEPSMPFSYQHSTPVGSYGAHSRHLPSPPRASDNPPADLGGPVGLVRGRNQSQKPLGSPELSRSRSLHAKPATITINVTPAADGVPSSIGLLPVSSVPITPSSAPRSERTVSSTSTYPPVTPAQMPLPLPTRFTPNPKAKVSPHGQESDPFESSLNPAALLPSRLHPQSSHFPTPVLDVPRTVPTNGGGYVWIGAPSVQTEAPSPSASSQRSRPGASFMRRLKGLFRRNP